MARFADCARQSEEMMVDEVKRELPLLKMCLVALPSMTITLMWTVCLPNAGPYMMRLGLSPAMATLNNLAGPISGFFTEPIVGAVSDSLASPYGRRRPVIVVGLLLMIVAAGIFSSSECLLPAGKAAFLAAPMYWILDVTINVYMTPIRALIADLASRDQQLPLQAIVPSYQAVGALIGFTLMKSYDVPSEHLFELMAIACAMNCVTVAIQFYLAKEKPFVRVEEDAANMPCGPIAEIREAVRGSSMLLRHLSAIQFVAFAGLTAWMIYPAQWFGICVFKGDPAAPEGSLEHDEYAMGQEKFVYGGQCKSLLQLLFALVVTSIVKRELIPPKIMYAVSLVIGALVSVTAAFIPAHNGSLAVICMALSVIPQVGVFSIPFGLIAADSKRAESEGKGNGSTALQMGLLNCALTLGQQFATFSLALLEGRMEASRALPLVFLIAAASFCLGSVGALALGSGSTNGDELEGRLDDADPKGNLLPLEMASPERSRRIVASKEVP